MTGKSSRSENRESGVGLLTKTETFLPMIWQVSFNQTTSPVSGSANRYGNKRLYHFTWEGTV